MEKTVYISASWNKYDKAFNYSVRAYSPGEGEVLVEERVITFDTLNDKELRLRMHVALMERKKTILADAMLEAKELQETADELLALEYIPTVEASDDIPF